MSDQAQPQAVEQEVSQEVAPQEQQEVSSSQEAAPATPGEEAKKEAIKEEIKRLSKIKLKIDGEEIEEDLPFDIEDDPAIVEYLKNNLQLSKVARKRMEETSKYKSAIEQIADMIEKNPAMLLEKAGKNPEEWAVAYLKSKIAEAEMDPKEKELLEARRQLEALQKEKEELRKAQEQKELQLMQDKIEREYEQTLIEALESSGLPKDNPIVTKQMAELMYVALQNNLEIPPSELASIVKENYINSMKNFLKSSPDEFIEELLGKDRIVGFRKKDIKKLKEAAAITSAVSSNTVSTNKPSKEVVVPENEKATMNLSDWLNGR